MVDILAYFSGLVVACFMFWFLLMLTDAWRLRRLRKKYDESKDLSKVGETNSRGLRTGGETGRESISGERGFTEGEYPTERSNKPERREFLQTTTPKPVRENSPSFRVSYRK